MAHDGVFTEVHFTVHHSIGEVLYIGCCRDGFGFFALISFRKLHGLIGSLNVGNRFFQKIGQLRTRNRTDGNIILAVRGAFQNRVTQNHFRVVYKVAVHGVSFFGAVQMHPIRNDVNRMVTLLQEDDVGHDFCACVLLKGIVWQTNGTKQFRPLCQIPPCIRVLGIHGITACHKSDHTAGTNLIQSFGEEIVVDGESQLIIRLIGYLVVTERYIAHSQIVEVSAVCRFKTGDFDFCVGIELLRNPAGDGIQLHTVQAAALHLRGQHTEEVTDTHGRFQNVAGLKAHLSDCIIDGANDRRTGIVGVQRRSSCRSILVIGQQILQSGVLLRPISLIRVKGICQTAPADIVRQDLLFFGSSVSVLALQLEQGLDGFHISCKFLFRSTFTDVVIRDVEVHRRNGWNFSGCDGLLNLSDDVHDFGILPAVHLGVVLNNRVLTVPAMNEVKTAR